ncbi:hypothetical protein L6164_032850 [Bauhinia variegata]|uniref:Uncharacterized protein n=1 Tax=Bauhinia variegata TaxID=167791 RepID=A0ACB9KQS0_BAUVA|nr:hypothetical protein L6164_032850 [Bauhinia variegata]
MTGMKNVLQDIHLQNNKTCRDPLIGISMSREQKLLSSFSRSLSVSRRKVNLRLRKRAKQTPAMAVLHGDRSMELAMAMTEKLTALVTVRYNKAYVEEVMNNFVNIFSPKSHSGVVLQLISTEFDPRSNEPKLSKETILEWPKEMRLEAEGSTYQVEFLIDSDFGIPGALTVINNYEYEFFLESITIDEYLHFACKYWVQPNALHPEKRFFFTNKAYLPSETPIALKELREKELRQLRGEGRGVRIFHDRIYDYDVYNDLGDPDKGDEYVRPTLGGPENPHPRRCRTGRPPTNTEKKAESRLSESESIYVPREEELEKLKRKTVEERKLKGKLRNIVPFLLEFITGDGKVSDVESLFKEPAHSEMKSHHSVLDNLRDSIEEYFKFDPPKIFLRNTSIFLPDDEFGRQVLAGINPLSIERLKVFPPTSKFDTSIYGPLESALKEEHIKGHIEGLSVQQALEENKLYILDYHDIYLPILERINALDQRKTYATRTIFFLTQMGTLKPIAIELTLPPQDPNTPSRQVLTPPTDAATNWLWRLGKAHVRSNDAVVHQLVHHWLRTHACVEPFIIATHRQLSVMHPIFKLLHPHMRYTMKINAMARETLINAGGIIETDFTPGKYCMQISCAAYRDWWRFDLEALPADLIRRGVAVPDTTQPHGLRLLIEDYPYASDGLLIWSSIEKLVKTYVNHYYKDANAIATDNEIQSWYRESINLGHADLQNAKWWPKLATPDNLASIITTIIWIVSAEHAALNFSQYPYGGYVPTWPPLMRRLIPMEQDPEYTDFVTDPQSYFLSSLPSLFQATKFMAVMDMISAHSPDEEYIGDIYDMSSWLGNNEIIVAFYQFSMEIKSIEKEIERRNADPELRNRCGAGVSPYEQLIPSSGPGTTGRGIPKSITV